MSFTNQNFRVGGRPLEKKASAYDRLAAPNRQTARPLFVSTFTPRDNEQLQSYIAKQAEALMGTIEKRANTIDKQAYLDGGMDMFTRTKGLLQQKLGATEDTAHALASPVVTKAYDIQNQYGGDPGSIIDRLVEEMQGHMTDKSLQAAVQASGSVRENMAVVTTKKLEENIKARLVSELKVNNYNADGLARSVVSEARDMSSMFRPHRMDEIANVIVDVMKQHGDLTIVYGLKNNHIYIEEMRSLLDPK